MIDLSEKPRVAVDLRLGDATFRITRVVVAVRHIYGEFLKEGGALMGKVARVQELEESFSEASGEDATREIEEISKEIEHYSAQKIDLLLTCIEYLLIRNGYEFDREWWIQNGDEMDYQGFIVECVMKDSAGKKKIQEEDGSTGGA